MKHLLIILSFLLLSSPVIGDKHTLPVSGGKSETLYQWETYSGKDLGNQKKERIWKYFGDNKIHSKYVGEVKNGFPNGLGILYYRDISGNGSGMYVGSWEDGYYLTGTDYDENGTPQTYYVNGKEIK